MLDKSVPYKHVIMKMDNEKNNFDDLISLPDGFSFSFYKDGFERNWAKTEHQVLEFDTELLAYEYFAKNMLPFKEELKKRMIFILNNYKEPIANACAWYVDLLDETCKGEPSKLIRQAQVHYLAVQPEYQGLGLGNALIKKTLSLFKIYEPGKDIYLHTQTWSHRAIRMYLKIGFELIKDDSLGYTKKEYNEAVKILEQIYSTK